LATRLYAAKGWPDVHGDPVDHGAHGIPEGSPGLDFYENGIGYTPTPGDLIIENARPGNQYGHVAVIDTVGSTTIKAVEQNADPSGWHTYSRSGSTISGGYGSVRGVAHAPQNTAAASVGTTTIGAVKRLADGTFQWNLRNSNNAGGASITPFVFGRSDANDIPVTGDWDGNRTRTIGAVKRLINGTFQWNLRNSNTSGGASIVPFVFGRSDTNDTPVTGDWDGNGTTTIGVVKRLSDGTFQWNLRNANSTGGASITPFVFGRWDTNDTPVTGDWDGNGTTTIGVVKRLSDGTFQWNLRNSNNAGGASITPFVFGRWDTNDTPVTGDWDGNKLATIGAVKRSADGTFQWNLRNSNSSGGVSITAFAFGRWDTNDVAVTGDWNGA
jgi:uncharacterized protein YegP (UPF0339 family)